MAFIVLLILNFRPLRVFISLMFSDGNLTFLYSFLLFVVLICNNDNVFLFFFFFSFFVCFVVFFVVNSSFCLGKYDNRLQPMCGCRQCDDEFKECQSLFGTYTIQMPINNSVECSGQQRTHQNCKDFDVCCIMFSIS